MGDCVECKDTGEKVFEAVYDDPREPPMEDPRNGPCLCATHYIGAADDRIDTLQEEIHELQLVLRAARKKSLMEMAGA